MPKARTSSRGICARFAGLPLESLDAVLVGAVQAGLLQRQPDDLDLIRLTEAGMAVARGRAQR